MIQYKLPHCCLLLFTLCIVTVKISTSSDPYVELNWKGLYDLHINEGYVVWKTFTFQIHNVRKPDNPEECLYKGLTVYLTAETPDNTNMAARAKMTCDVSRDNLGAIVSMLTDDTLVYKLKDGRCYQATYFRLPVPPRVLESVHIKYLCSEIPRGLSDCQRLPPLQVLDADSHPVLNIPFTAEEAVDADWDIVAYDRTLKLDIYRYKQSTTFLLFYYNNRLVGIGPTYNVLKNTQLTRIEYRDKAREGGYPRATSTWLRAKVGSTWRRLAEKGRRWRFVYNKTVRLPDVTIRYGMILFIHPMILRRGLEDACTRNTIYFKDIAKWRSVPYRGDEVLLRKQQLLKQGCVNGRGQYYFYGLRNVTDWRDFNGFFALYDRHRQLTGFGVMIIGESNTDYQITNPLPIYTRVRHRQIRDIIPYTSPGVELRCYTEGLTALHINMAPTTDFACDEEIDTLTDYQEANTIYNNEEELTILDKEGEETQFENEENFPTDNRIYIM